MQGKFKYKYEGGGNSDPAYLEVEFQQLGEVKVEGQKVKINFFGPGEVSDFIEFCEEVARLNKPLD